MQLKLEHVMLSITDEMSMVGFKQFQSMNQTMCTLKGTTDGSCLVSQRELAIGLCIK